MHVSRQQTLSVALEAFEAPHDALAVWLVNGAACPAREDANLGGVRGHWDLADHVRAEVALFEDSRYSNSQHVQ